MQHPGHRRRIGLVLRIAGTIIALWWVMGRVEPDVALQALSEAPLWVFVVPSVGVFFNTIIQGIRIQRMLMAMGARLSLGRVLSAVCRGAFMGLVLPSGGQEVAKAALLAKATSRMDVGIGALLAARVLQLPMWALLLTWSLYSGLLVSDPVLGMAAAGFLCVICVVLGLSFWGLQREDEPHVFLPRWTPARLVDGVQRIVVALRMLRSHPQAILIVASLALPAAVINIGVVWAILWGFSAPLDPGEVAALLPAADVLIWMPIRMSGLGVREGLFAYFLAPRGVGVATAVAIGLTRWTGELMRALVGGLLFVLGDTVFTGPATDGPRSSRDG